jgi:hypothetical protein
LAKALSNHPISDSVTFKAGIAQYRLGKVVAISKWRYLLYGRDIKIASVTSRIPHNVEWVAMLTSNKE